jgi:hypothetical protein
MELFQSRELGFLEGVETAVVELATAEGEAF